MTSALSFSLRLGRLQSFPRARPGQETTAARPGAGAARRFSSSGTSGTTATPAAPGASNGSPVAAAATGSASASGERQASHGDLKYRSVLQHLEKRTSALTARLNRFLHLLNTRPTLQTGPLESLHVVLGSAPDCCKGGDRVVHKRSGGRASAGCGDQIWVSPRLVMSANGRRLTYYRKHKTSQQYELP